MVTVTDIDILDGFFFFAFFCSFAYITGYTLLAPWWRNPWGRGMVAFSAATMLILAPIILRLWFHISANTNLFLVWYYIGALALSGLVELYRLRWAYHVQQHDTPRGHRQDDFNTEHRAESEKGETW